MTGIAARWTAIATEKCVANRSNDRVFFHFNSARKSSCKLVALSRIFNDEFAFSIEIGMRGAAKIASMFFRRAIVAASMKGSA
jgi:hypothetical protein